MDLNEILTRERDSLRDENIELRNKIVDHEKIEIEKASLEKNVEVITELLNERVLFLTFVRFFM